MKKRKNSRFCTVKELLSNIRNRNMSIHSIVLEHVNRTKKVNPSINAVIADCFDEALSTALDYDSKLEKMNDIPPLFGIPCTIKESFAVKGMPNTLGIVNRKNTVSKSDATCVKRLKEAGAIVIGLTNVPEYCNWIETKNKIYGETVNPYDAKRTCGGSSGGEGAIIGAGGSPFGLGSDIAGSIRFPSFFCGIVGHKPSHYLIPSTGHYDWNLRNLLSCGPMGRSVDDMALITKILAGPDGQDLDVQNINLNQKLPSKKAIRFFYFDEIPGYKVQKVIKYNIQYIVNKLKKAGIYTEKYIPKNANMCLKFLESTSETEGSNNTLQKQLKNEPFIFQKEAWKVLKGQSEHILTNFLLMTVESFAQPGKNGKETDEMQSLFVDMQKEVSEKLGDDGVLILPTFTQVAPRRSLVIFSSLDFVYCLLMNLMQMPVTQVPTGYTSDGLPLGVQVAANHGNDPLCWKAAGIVESIFGRCFSAKVLK